MDVLTTPNITSSTKGRKTTKRKETLVCVDPSPGKMKLELLEEEVEEEKEEDEEKEEEKEKEDQEEKNDEDHKEEDKQKEEEKKEEDE